MVEREKLSAAATIPSFQSSLEDALACPREDMRGWLYVPCNKLSYRFLLGEVGERPLICVGLNPSTAEPNNLDHTMKRVRKLSQAWGFDGYYMLNLYAQRATNPDDVDRVLDGMLHKENLEAIDNAFSMCDKPKVWAAWGIEVKRRHFYIDCLRDIWQLGIKNSVEWMCAGTTKEGHPFHPSRIADAAKLQPFDFDGYLDSVF